MKIDNREIIEECRKCELKGPRKEMRHTQIGFNAVWRCRDREACEKRMAKAGKCAHCGKQKTGSTCGNSKCPTYGI